MSRSSLSLRPPSVHVLFAGLALVLIARAAWVIQLDGPDFVTFLPDDAFYYFALGRNFAHLGSWTFDAGVSHASGFHLLQAYQSALIAGLFPASVPQLSLALSTAMALATAWLALRTHERLFGAQGSWALLPVFVSYPFLAGAVSGMEWGYCILFSALVYHQLSGVGSQPLSRLACLGLALTGLGLELSRSDAGLLIGALFVAATWTALRHGRRPMLVATGAALCGALLGLALTLAHTWWLRGSLVTGSAEVKHLWAQRSGPLDGLRGGYRLFVQTLGFPRDSAGMVVLAVVVAGLAYALFVHAKVARMGDTTADDPDAAHVRRTLVTGSALAAAGYLAMFCLNTAVLFWYAALITLPVLVLLGATVRAMHLAQRQLAIRVLALAGAASVANSLVAATAPMEDHHRHMYAAARYISAMPPGSRVGSWNAGIIGFFSPPGRVVNLDGLVNDDAIPYIQRNDLLAYMATTHITHIADFSQMVDGANSQKKGGYDAPRFRDGVHTLAVLSPVTRYIASDMRVYRVSTH